MSPRSSSPAVSSLFTRPISPNRRPASFRDRSESPDSHNSNGDQRRRAPRALTGRYVRSGTGASRRVLDILRKKLIERMRLKKLLGENSHLYFGALNQQKKKSFRTIIWRLSVSSTLSQPSQRRT